MTTEKAEPDTLLPCPFCGSDAEFERAGTFRQSCIIACTDCGCRLETGEVFRQGEQWNTRAAPARCDAQMELRKVLREARQYVADAGSDEDSETQANSAALLAEIDDCLIPATAKPAQGKDSMSSRLNYGPLDHFGPEDNDTGTAFIIHNVDDTVTIKVRSPGDRVFSEIEMPPDAWLKLRSVGAPRCDAQSVWEPTEAQLNSACLSYDHSFDMMPDGARNMVRFQAREWLRAWQREGAGADRREIIEECAAIVDQANREGPYQAISAASRIRALSKTKHHELAFPNTVERPTSLAP